MKEAKLRNWMEIVGIFAVVVSLIFVGLQMQQTQSIAIAEMNWNNMIAEMESRSAIYEHPDVWAKGNAGETLNPSESVIYTTLIRDFNSLQFHRVENFAVLYGGGFEELGGIVTDTSGFLFENPGARREWEALRATFRRWREPHTPGGYKSRFEEEVRAQLAVMDEMHRLSK
ncbi:MAG: hypothetical protein ABJK25_00350 [Halieaceae bacterium]